MRESLREPLKFLSDITYREREREIERERGGWGEKRERIKRDDGGKMMMLRLQKNAIKQ